MTSLGERRGGWLLLAVVVAVASGVAAATALRSTHDGPSQQRDEALFLSHVRESFGGWANPEPEGVADSVYVDEGDNACQWLADRPIDFGRAPHQTDYTLYRTFLREAEPVESWPVGSDPDLRASVIYDAWNYLCPDLRESRVWNPPPGSD